MTQAHRVVIVGGGFGGLYAALHLKRAPVEVTLLDRRNFHLFQPLLYQVATGALSPANIAAPLRSVLKRQKNTQVLLGEVTDFDLAERRVLLRDGAAVPYDTLIVAAGSHHHYFGHPEWEKHAPGLKTVEDATTMRRRILLAFEAAEREPEPEKARPWLTFVVVGGGPTGVELAGAVAEVARATLRHDFRRIDTASAQVLLLEAGERVLPTYPPDLSAKAEAALRRMGVSVRTRTAVKAVRADGVTVQSGDTASEIATRTVLWGAGVQASPLAALLARAAGAETDRAGRVLVGPDCSLPGQPEVFVIGDMAHFRGPDDKPLPGVAPVAMQQGRYVARLITARLRGKVLGPFRYRDYGSMATIGRAAAVADFGRVRFDGYLAWLAWLFVHLMNLVEYENRLLVFLQWAYSYVTRNRAARLITGEKPPAE